MDKRKNRRERVKIERLIHDLESKYNKELNTPDWSEWELEEMGDNMKRDISEALNVKHEVLEILHDLYKRYHR